MLIVAKGKVVNGRHVISPGGLIEGLSPEAEAQLIASGVAKRVGAIDVSGDWVDEGDDCEQVVPVAKEPSKAELQARCRELGLSARGSKAELQARIAEYEDSAGGELAEDGGDDATDDEPPELTAEVPR